MSVWISNHRESREVAVGSPQFNVSECDFSLTSNVVKSLPGNCMNNPVEDVMQIRILVFWSIALSMSVALSAIGAA